MNNNYQIMKDHLTLYARDANEQVMAIYERDTILNSAEGNAIYPIYESNIKISSSNLGCDYEVTLRNYNTTQEYSIDEDGVINVLVNKTIACTNNPGNYVYMAAGSKIYKNVVNGLNTQGTRNFASESNGWLKDTNAYYVHLYGGTGGDEYAVVRSKEFSLFSYSNSSNDRRVKLSEWHIYGNEQQGRFVTRKPENTLYYLENLTSDVINKNFFRVMDKKQYELKDHLGNVHATIGDYKMPANDATSTRGVAPYFVENCVSNLS